MVRKLSVAMLLTGCGGTDFVHDRPDVIPIDSSDAWISERPPPPAPSAIVSSGTRRPELFRNTYYDFPSEGDGAKKAKVFDAECKAIADVTQEFHDRVCLQGSDRLKTGKTISFARRNCACATECPKSGQKICFERLDPKKFPSGRGALGQPVTPLRTVAVDDRIIPMGSILYIPDFEGLLRPNGSQHDGCFVAEDRGSKVVGTHIDVFTGDPATTKAWNQVVPSNVGVRVEIDSPRCRHLAAPAATP
jgi:3D (Asp-Asp-Asp) domain-containing protein